MTWHLVRTPLLDGDPEELARLDWGKHVASAIHEGAARMTIPLRHRQLLRATANVLRRLLHPYKRRRRGMLVRAPALPVALTLLRMEYLLRGGHREVYEEWASALYQLGATPAPVEPRLEDSADAPRRGRSRRRRDRRRGSGGSDSGGDGGGQRSPEGS